MSHHAAVSVMDETPLAVAARRATIALVAFLTLVDLFAAQAILPSLAQAYGATPAEMGLAVDLPPLEGAIGMIGNRGRSGRCRRRGIRPSRSWRRCGRLTFCWARASSSARR